MLPLLLGVIASGLSACQSTGSRAKQSVDDQVSATSCAAYRDSAQATGSQIYLEDEVGPNVEHLPGPFHQPKFPRTNGAVSAQFIVDSTGRADEHTLRLLEVTSPELVPPLRRWLSEKRFSPARIGDRPVTQCVVMSFKIETF